MVPGASLGHEVYTGSNHQYAVDGGSASSMTASGWTNVGNASSITTLTLTGTDGNYPYFNAVRLNGVILTNLVGRNSFHLDFSDGGRSSGVGNDWNALNLNLGGDFTIVPLMVPTLQQQSSPKWWTRSEPYGEASGDFIGFAFAGEKITFKIENTSSNAKLFYIQPATNTSFSFVNGGTWAFLEAVLVAISGHSMPTVQGRNFYSAQQLCWNGSYLLLRKQYIFAFKH